MAANTTKSRSFLSQTSPNLSTIKIQTQKHNLKTTQIKQQKLKIKNKIKPKKEEDKEADLANLGYMHRISSSQCFEMI